MNPKVSIILPTYNGEKFISYAIKSVLSQSFTNWELLIIDDGSTDNTKDLAIKFSKEDERIFYIRNDFNLGIQKSLNKGIKIAKGEYVARIDDDDVWVDFEKLKDQVEFLESNQDYVLIGTGAVVINENRKEIFRYLNPQTDEKIRKIFLKRNPFIHSSVVFRKKTAILLGSYTEKDSVLYVEDYDLWLRIGRVGKVYNLPKYSTCFMSRVGNITNKNRIMQAKKVIFIINKNKKFYPKYITSIIFAYFRLLVFYFLKIFPKSFINFIFKIYKTIN